MMHIFIAIVVCWRAYTCLWWEAAGTRDYFENNTEVPLPGSRHFQIKGGAK